MGRKRDASGFTTGASLIAMVAGMVILVALLLLAVHPFGGSTTTNGSSSGSLLSQSSAENQIKLCAEGRDSTYGNPPTPSQQAWCVRQLATQAAGIPAIP